MVSTDKLQHHLPHHNIFYGLSQAWIYYFLYQYIKCVAEFLEHRFVVVYITQQSTFISSFSVGVVGCWNDLKQCWIPTGFD